MMEAQNRYARLAARLLRNEQASPLPSDRRRDEIVAAMALTIAGQVRRRRILRATGLALAAAAAIVLVVRGTRSGSRPDTLVVETVEGAGSTLLRAERAEPLTGARSLSEGDVVLSHQDSRATLLSGRNTHLTLSAAARLRVDQLGPTRRFSLAQGRLQAEVAKLARGERFLVATPDIEVEVRGTAFDVAIGEAPAGCRNTSQSTVHVREGAVWVRLGGREILLQPGDTLTSPCAERVGPAPPTVAPEPAESHAAPAPARPAARRAGSAAKPVAPSPAPVQPAAANAQPISRLAEQNELFAAAMAAERHGQHDQALRQLDELIRRFPSGPLHESAQAERQRILSAQPAR